MNLNDMNSQAEKYKQEMMKLYGKRIPDIPATYETVSEEISSIDSDAPDDSAWSEFSEENSESIGDDYNTRYPEPDLSGLENGEYETENNSPPQYPDIESLGNQKGFILVNVRTGDNSSAVTNASVQVTATVDGKRMIIAGGITDSSGIAPKFEVPVPDSSLSQTPDSRKRPYNLFDISVTADGFFNARSVDVPVFEGITSVQNFSMIPLPLMMKSTDETVTYYNQEPDFSNNI